jgi:hypothetical protein
MPGCLPFFPGMQVLLRKPTSSRVYTVRRQGITVKQRHQQPTHILNTLGGNKREQQFHDLVKAGVPMGPCPIYYDESTCWHLLSAWLCEVRPVLES